MLPEDEGGGLCPPGYNLDGLLPKPGATNDVPVRVIHYPDRYCPIMDSYVFDDDKAADCLKRASDGDPVARGAIMEIVSEFLLRGVALTEGLSKFVIQELARLEQDRKRGGKKRTLDERDFNIGYVVYDAHRVWGVDFISDDTSQVRRTPCACSITSAALERVGIHLEKRSVYKLWRRHEPNITMWWESSHHDVVGYDANELWGSGASGTKVRIDARLDRYRA